MRNETCQQKIITMEVLQLCCCCCCHRPQKNKVGRTILFYAFLLLLQAVLGASLSSSSSSSSLTPPSSSSIVRVVVSTKQDTGNSQTFFFDDNGDAVVEDSGDDDNQRSGRSKRARRDLKNNNNNIGWSRIPSLLRSTFLPAGYSRSGEKASISASYLRYCLWSVLQDLSTQLRSVLATQRILEGVGVGRAEASALSALTNFIVRDAAGMATTLLFTAKAASQFKTNVKKWRLLADCAVDLGITLEVAATAVPQRFFLPMICAGNMFKAICGVAAGATGGALNLYWSRQLTAGDIADVQAKSGAQNSVSGALGLVASALFARTVTNCAGSRGLWLIYAALTVLHIYANRQCMKLVAFDAFNTDRLNMIMAATTATAATNNANTNTLEELSTLPTPAQVSRVEPLFFGPKFRFPRILRRQEQPNNCSPSLPIYFGVSFDEFAKRSRKSAVELQHDMLISQQTRSSPSNSSVQSPYWIAVGGIPRPRSCIDGVGGGDDKNRKMTHKRRRRPKLRPCIVVALQGAAKNSNSDSNDADYSNSPLQQTKAYFHAFVLGRAFRSAFERITANDDDALAAAAATAASAAEREVQEWLNGGAWDAFATACQAAGWDLTATELTTKGYEISMVTDKRR